MRLRFQVWLRFAAKLQIMHIVAIAWIYVVLMMSITEHTVVAGVMTFLFYGVVPVTIILYLMGASARKRKRRLEENASRLAEQQGNTTAAPPDTGK